MVEVYNRNVVSNFKYTIKAVTIFMSRIVLKRLNADHKLLFRKLEKDLKYYIIIIKKDWQYKAGRVRLTPYQSEDPSPHTTNL